MNYKEILNEREVKFTFLKKDGSERMVRGTTNLTYVPSEKYPKIQNEADPDYKPRKVNESVVSYFDLDIGEWRTFIKDNLIEFDGIKLK